MFREMRRFKQRLSEKECVEVLKNEPRGVLSVAGDDGYPYGMPLDHYYEEESGKIYFHGAAAGHRIDSIRRDNRVSYCVYDKGYRNDGDWALNIRSVIVFGRIREAEDKELIRKVLRNLSHKFTDDEKYIEDEIIRNIGHVKILEITVEHMTGKLVNES